MGNERNTENLVRDLLQKKGYASNAGITIEEQSSKNPRINKLLKDASKSGKGKGYPEFIISFDDRPDDVVVIECKADTAKHESKDRKQYKDYAVDGVLLYADHLRSKFNVFAIAVSGETNEEVIISNFLWLKGKTIQKDINDKDLLTPESLFEFIEKQTRPLTDEDLNRQAIELNKELHSYSVPEVERCNVISAILVALQDTVFRESYKKYYIDAKGEDRNPNAELIDALLIAAERVFKGNNVSDSKRELILGEYSKIKQNITFRDKHITIKKQKKQNRVLRNLISKINEHVMPYVNNNVYDILGKFYTQFIRYTGGDQKTGLVLTPPHITELFCELADLQKNDVVYDPCCGTGGFLVSAMDYMLRKAGNDSGEHQTIKSERLIGVERRADMFSHASSNMMMRGDGKSHIYYGDCFDERNKNIVKKAEPTKTFLNPPYDGGEDKQLEFVENALEDVQKNGLCIAICQMSTVVGNNKDVVAVRKRLLENHTLEAVLSVPNDIFHPVGVVTCIIIFKAHNPHPKNKETFFGYFKDDGFVKAKHRGRVDVHKRWDGIKQRWLDAYMNQKVIAGLSVKQKVTAEDEWCAEAYMETDYSTLTDDDFIQTVKNYVAYQFLHDQNSIKKPSAEILKQSAIEIDVRNWQAFRYDEIFSVSRGYFSKRPETDESIDAPRNIPFIGATEKSNGVTSWLSVPEISQQDKQLIQPKADGPIYNANSITVSNNGSVGYAFFQSVPFTCSSDVNVLYLLDDKIISPYLAMFLCAVIGLDRYRWNYARKWIPKRMANSIIKLPTDKEGSPDWEFMENFIKSQPCTADL